MTPSGAWTAISRRRQRPRGLGMALDEDQDDTAIEPDLPAEPTPAEYLDALTLLIQLAAYHANLVAAAPNHAVAVRHFRHMGKTFAVAADVAGRAAKRPAKAEEE